MVDSQVPPLHRSIPTLAASNEHTPHLTRLDATRSVNAAAKRKERADPAETYGRPAHDQPGVALKRTSNPKAIAYTAAGRWLMLATITPPHVARCPLFSLGGTSPRWLDFANRAAEPLRAKGSRCRQRAATLPKQKAKTTHSAQPKTPHNRVKHCTNTHSTHIQIRSVHQQTDRLDAPGCERSLPRALPSPPPVRRCRLLASWPSRCIATGACSMHSNAWMLTPSLHSTRCVLPTSPASPRLASLRHPPASFFRRNLAFSSSPFPCPTCCFPSDVALHRFRRPQPRAAARSKPGFRRTNHVHRC